MTRRVPDPPAGLWDVAMITGGFGASCDTSTARIESYRSVVMASPNGVGAARLVSDLRVLELGARLSGRNGSQ